MKINVELWVACQLYGKPKGKPTNPANQFPVGTFKADNWIAKKPAYTSRRAVFGAARYVGFSKPSYHDCDIIVYTNVGHYSKQIEHAIFVKNTVAVDISKIKYLIK